MFFKGGKWPLSWYIPCILYSFVICYFVFLFSKYYNYVYIYNYFETFSSLFYNNLTIFFLFLCFISRNFTNNKFNTFIMSNLKNKIKNIEVANGIIKNIHLKIINIYLQFLTLIQAPFVVFFILFFRFLFCLYVLLVLIFKCSFFLKFFLVVLGFIFWFFICSILYHSIFLSVLNDLKLFIFPGMLGSQIMTFVINLILSLKQVIVSEEQKISFCYRRTFAAYNWEIYWFLFNFEDDNGGGDQGYYSSSYAEILSNPMTGSYTSETVQWNEQIEEFDEKNIENIEDELLELTIRYKKNKKEEVATLNEEYQNQVERSKNWGVLEGSSLWFNLIEEYRNANNEFMQNFNNFSSSTILDPEILLDDLSSSLNFVDFNSPFDSLEEDEEIHFQFEYECLGRWSIYTTPFELGFWAFYQYLYIYKAWICEILSILFFSFFLFIIIFFQFYFLNDILFFIDSSIWFLRWYLMGLLPKIVGIYSSSSWILYMLDWRNLVAIIWFIVIYFIFIDENDTERAFTPIYNKNGRFISWRNYSDWLSWKIDTINDWKDFCQWLDKDDDNNLWKTVDDRFLFLDDIDELSVLNVYKDLKDRKLKEVEWKQPKKVSEESDYIINDSFLFESFPDFGIMFRKSLIEIFLSCWYFLLFQIFKNFTFLPSLRYFLTNCLNILFYIGFFFICIFIITPLLIWVFHIQTEPISRFSIAFTDNLYLNEKNSENPLSKHYTEFFTGVLNQETSSNFMNNSNQNFLDKVWYNDPISFVCLENYYFSKKFMHNYRVRSYLAQNELIQEYSAKLQGFPINEQATAFLPLNTKLIKSWELYGANAGFPGEIEKEELSEKGKEEQNKILRKSKFKSGGKMTKEFFFEDEEKSIKEEKTGKNILKMDEKIFDNYNEKIREVFPWYEGKKITSMYFLLSSLDNKKEINTRFKQLLSEYYLKNHGGKNISFFGGDSQYLGNHESWYWKKNGRFNTQSTAEPIFGNDVNFSGGGHDDDLQNIDIFFNYGFRKSNKSLKYFKNLANYSNFQNNINYVYPFHIHNIQPISTVGRGRWTNIEEIFYTGQKEVHSSGNLYAQEFVANYASKTIKDNLNFHGDSSEYTYCGLPLNWKIFSGLKPNNKLSKIEIINKYNNKNCCILKNKDFYLKDSSKNLQDFKISRKMEIQKKTIIKLVMNAKLYNLDIWYKNINRKLNINSRPSNFKQNNLKFLAAFEDIKTIKELKNFEKFQLKTSFGIRKEIKIIKLKYKQHLRLFENKKANMLSLMLIWNNKLIMHFENSLLKKKTAVTIPNESSFLLESSNYSLWYFKYYEILEKIKALEKEHNYNIFFNKIQNENYKTYLNVLELKLKNNFQLSLLLHKKFLGIQGIIVNKKTVNKEIQKPRLETFDSEKVSLLLSSYSEKAFMYNKASVYYKPSIRYESLLNHSIEINTMLLPDINGLSKEFFTNNQDEKIYKKYYWNLYKKMKFLDTGDIKELGSIPLNTIKNNPYIKDLKFIFKNYTQLNTNSFKKLYYIKYKLKRFDYQNNYDKEQLIVLVNFIGKQFNWNGSFNDQKKQFLFFIQNFLNNSHNKNTKFLVETKIKYIKNLLITKSIKSSTNKQIKELIAKNTVVKCFYSIFANENNKIIDNINNIVKFESYLGQYFLSGVKPNSEIRSLFKFFEIVFPAFKKIKQDRYKFVAVINFLRNTRTCLINSDENLIYEFQIGVLLKSRGELDEMPSSLFRNKFYYLCNKNNIRSLKKFGVNSTFYNCFYKLLKLHSTKTLTQEHNNDLMFVEERILNYYRLLKLNIQSEDHELFNAFLHGPLNFSVFDSNRIKCVEQLLKILKYIKLPKNNIQNFDSLSYVLDKANNDYIDWNWNLLYLNKFYKNQINLQIDEQIKQHKNWIKYLTQQVVLKPLRPINTIKPDFLLNNYKKIYKYNFFNKKDTRVFYANWFRNLTRVSEKNTVWKLKTKILGPSNLMELGAFKHNNENIYVEVPNKPEIIKNEKQEIKNEILKKAKILYKPEIIKKPGTMTKFEILNKSNKLKDLEKLNKTEKLKKFEKLNKTEKLKKTKILNKPKQVKKPEKILTPGEMLDKYLEIKNDPSIRLINHPTVTIIPRSAKLPPSDVIEKSQISWVNTVEVVKITDPATIKWIQDVRDKEILKEPEIPMVKKVAVYGKHLKRRDLMLLDEFKSDIFREHHMYTGISNPWNSENICNHVLWDVLLSQILTCVDNAEIKFVHESVVNKINSFIKTLNNTRAKDEITRLRHRGIKTDHVPDVKYTKKLLRKIFELQRYLPLAPPNKSISDRCLKQVLKPFFPTLENNETFLQKLALLSVICPVIKGMHDQHITFKALHQYSLSPSTATKVQNRLFGRSYIKIHNHSLFNFTKEDLLLPFKNIIITKNEDNKFHAEMDYLKKDLDQIFYYSLKKYNLEDLVKAIFANKRLEKDAEFNTFLQGRKDNKYNADYVAYDLNTPQKKTLLYLEKRYKNAISQFNNSAIQKPKIENYFEYCDYAKRASAQLEKTMSQYITKKVLYEQLLEDREDLSAAISDSKLSVNAALYQNIQFEKARSIGAKPKIELKTYKRNKEYIAQSTALKIEHKHISNQITELTEFFTLNTEMHHLADMERLEFYKTILKNVVEKSEIYAQILNGIEDSTVEQYRIEYENYEKLLKEYKKRKDLENKLKIYAKNEEIQWQCIEGLRRFYTEKKIKSILSDADVEYYKKREKFVNKLALKNIKELKRQKLKEVEKVEVVEIVEIVEIKEGESAEDVIEIVEIIEEIEEVEEEVEKKTSKKNYIPEYDQGLSESIESLIKNYMRLNEIIQTKDEPKYIIIQNGIEIKNVFDQILHLMSCELMQPVDLRELVKSVAVVKELMQIETQSEDLYDSEEKELRMLALAKWVVETAMKHPLHKITKMGRTYTFKEFESMVNVYSDICKNKLNNSLLEEEALKLLEATSPILDDIDTILFSCVDTENQLSSSPSSPSSPSSLFEPSKTSSSSGTFEPSKTSSSSGTFDPSMTLSASGNFEPFKIPSFGDFEPYRSIKLAETAAKLSTKMSSSGTFEPSTESSSSGTFEPSTESSSSGTFEPSTESSSSGTFEPSTESSSSGTFEPSTESSSSGTFEPSTESSSSGTFEPSTESSSSGTFEPSITLSASDYASEIEVEQLLNHNMIKVLSSHIYEPVLSMPKSTSFQIFNEDFKARYEDWADLTTERDLFNESYIGYDIVRLENQKSEELVEYTAEEVFILIKLFEEEFAKNPKNVDERTYDQYLSMCFWLCGQYNSFEYFYFFANDTLDVIRLTKDEVIAEISYWDESRDPNLSLSYNKALLKSYNRWLKRIEAREINEMSVFNMDTFLLSRSAAPNANVIDTDVDWAERMSQFLENPNLTIGLIDRKLQELNKEEVIHNSDKWHQNQEFIELLNKRKLSINLENTEDINTIKTAEILKSDAIIAVPSINIELQKIEHSKNEQTNDLLTSNIASNNNEPTADLLTSDIVITGDKEIDDFLWGGTDRGVNEQTSSLLTKDIVHNNNEPISALLTSNITSNINERTSNLFINDIINDIVSISTEQIGDSPISNIAGNKNEETKDLLISDIVNKNNEQTAFLTSFYTNSLEKDEISQPEVSSQMIKKLETETPEKDERGVSHWTPGMKKLSENENIIIANNERPYVYKPSGFKKHINIQKTKKPKLETNLWLINVFERGTPEIYKPFKWTHFNTVENFFLKLENLKNLRILHHKNAIKFLELEKKRTRLTNINLPWLESNGYFFINSRISNANNLLLLNKNCVANYYIAKFKVKNLDKLYFLSFAENQKWSKIYANEHTAMPLYGGVVNGKVSVLFEMYLLENVKFLKRLDDEEDATYFWAQGKSRSLDIVEVDFSKNNIFSRDEKADETEKRYPQLLTIISSRDSLYSHHKFYAHVFDELGSLYISETASAELFSNKIIANDFGWKSPTMYLPNKESFELFLEGKQFMQKRDNNYLKSFLQNKEKIKENQQARIKRLNIAKNERFEKQLITK